MFAGFLLLTAGEVGLATIQPSDNTSQLIFSGLAGLGFACPLMLIISGVQLSTPHHLIATATAVTSSSRAVSATIFTAIYATAVSTGLKHKIPTYVASAGTSAGVPQSSIKAFVTALASGDNASLLTIPGVDSYAISVGLKALQHAYADSLRVVFIIAAPFGALACILCLFLGDLRATMNYRVDAPVEKLHSKFQQNPHAHEKDSETLA